MNKRTSAIVLVIVCCAITAFSISSAGRRWMNGVAGIIKSGQPEHAPSVLAAPLQPTGDVESNAREQHGWSDHIQDSVVHGKIAYYDDRGNQTSSAALTLYRIYPDLLRVELAWDTGTGTDLFGVDENDAWVHGVSTSSADDMRDIRAFLRIWPERLFVLRNNGAGYRELGSHTEDVKLAGPGEPPVDIDPAITFDQVQVEDLIKISSTDKRILFFYVDRSNSRVSALRYMEPEDPNADPSEPGTDKIDNRVDFDNWHTVDSVLWPFLITHRLGGKVDFRIWVSDVSMNQSLDSSLFRRQ